MSAASWSVALAAAAAFVACATGAPKAPPDYADRVRARIEVAQQLEVQRLRFNPTPCSCPPFEIALDGRWHRVAFDAPEDSPMMIALRQAVEAPTATSRGFELRGRLRENLATCARGAILVTFNPTEWVDGPSIED